MEIVKPTNEKFESVEKRSNGVEHIFKSDEEKDTSVSYFNGLLVFKTKIVWLNVIAFIFMHYFWIYGLYTGLSRMFSTGEYRWFAYAYFVGILCGVGIGCGAHRLFTHRCYKAKTPLRIVLMILQTMAGQNSIYIWARDHRQHHKYSDTDADPHNSGRGFFFSHMGWLMMRKHPEVLKKGPTIDMSDLKNDPIVMFQYRYMYPLYIIFSVLLPSAIPYFLNERGMTFTECLLWFWMTRYLTSLHITWCVNSVTHFYGARPYDQKLRPSENAIVSFFTNGEGWHNYHHIFPWDYKAAENLWKLNVSGIMIKFFELMGWAYDLKEASPEMIHRKIVKDGDSTFEWRKKIKLQEKEPTEIEPETYGF